MSEPNPIKIDEYKFGTDADNQGCSGIEFYVGIALIVVVISIKFYHIGYDQGRNDGFKSGWNEAINKQTKE